MLTNTGHGNCKNGISLLSNANIGPATLKGAICHENLETTADYHNPDQADMDRGSMALLGVTKDDFRHVCSPINERRTQIDDGTNDYSYHHNCSSPNT